MGIMVYSLLWVMQDLYHGLYIAEHREYMYGGMVTRIEISIPRGSMPYFLKILRDPVGVMEQ